MNYQGALVRKDLVWSGVVFWFLVRYYPHLSAVLLLCLLISTYWESTSQVNENIAIGKPMELFSNYLATSSVQKFDFIHSFSCTHLFVVCSFLT